MANRGYPDNDGSRETDNPRTDLGRQRPNIYDVEDMMTPASVADYAGNRDPIVNRTDSTGQQTMPPFRGPIDGDANTTPGRALAAYPSFTSSA